MQIQNIPIDQVYLDLQNPRSKFSNHSLEQNDPFDESQQRTTAALLRQHVGEATDYSVEALKLSIEASGGITNPIWVKLVESKYICIEGNTRLMLYKALALENPDDEKWITIPAIVHENITPQFENQLKLTAHIVGARQWRPYNKAKYAKELQLNSVLDWDQIRDIVGGQVSNLKKQVHAVEDFDTYFVDKYGTNHNDKFSHYIELEGRPQIQASMNHHGIQKEEFAEWVADNKFKRAINIRHLGEILENPEAFDAFKTDGFPGAEPFLHKAAIDITEVETSQLSDELQQRLNSMSGSQLERDNELITSLMGLGSSLNDVSRKLEEAGIEKPDDN